MDTKLEKALRRLITALGGTPDGRNAALLINGLAEAFEDGDIELGDTSFASLDDVTITDADNAQILVYDETASKWVNVDLALTGGTVTYADGTITLALNPSDPAEPADPADPEEPTNG